MNDHSSATDIAPTTTASRELHVQQLGEVSDDPIVLLLHAGIVNGDAWMPVAERLHGEGHTVIVPDLPGFGRSPDPAPDMALVDDLIAMLDTRAVESCAVIGWSFGGAVAMDLALEAPERVTALGLVCAVPNGMDRDPWVEAAWEREDDLVVAGDWEGVIANDIATWVVGIDRAEEDVDPAVVEHVRASLRIDYARPEAEHEAPDVEPPAMERFGELTCPVLTIDGEHDAPDARQSSALLREILPDVTSWVLPRTAHVPPLEHPEAVADAIAAWLDDREWTGFDTLIDRLMDA